MNTVQEAKRYLDNAREISRGKVHKQNGFIRTGNTSGWPVIQLITAFWLFLDSLLENKKKGVKM